MNMCHIWGGFAGLPSCWALLVSFGSAQPEPRNMCIAKGLRLDLFQDLKSETSETSGPRFNYYLMVVKCPRNSIEKISDITRNCPKNGANDQIWSNERSQPVVTKLAIVDDLQILLVNRHSADYAKFQPFFAVMVLFIPVIFMGLEVSSSHGRR